MITEWRHFLVELLALISDGTGQARRRGGGAAVPSPVGRGQFPVVHARGGERRVDSGG